MVVVVEVQDHGAEGETLLAAFGAGPEGVLETLEEPREVPRADAIRLAGQAVHPLVRRPERAGGSAAFEVVAERLVGP
jgi:hypothetical protein